MKRLISWPEWENRSFKGHHPWCRWSHVDQSCMLGVRDMYNYCSFFLWFVYKGGSMTWVNSSGCVRRVCVACLMNANQWLVGHRTSRSLRCSHSRLMATTCGIGIIVRDIDMVSTSHTCHQADDTMHTGCSVVSPPRPFHNCFLSLPKHVFVFPWWTETPLVYGSIALNCRCEQVWHLSTSEFSSELGGCCGTSVSAANKICNCYWNLTEFVLRHPKLWFHIGSVLTFLYVK